MRENQVQKLGFLTSREYAWLKEQPELSEEEKAKIAEFEEASPEEDLSTPKHKRAKIQITNKLLWKNFLLFYRHTTGREFEQTPESLKNVGVIINYFAKEEAFFQSENLVNRIGKTTLEPSLNKGLLIVGVYGNGKTSILRALCKMFNHYQMPMRFKSVNAHDIVTEYETVSNPGEKYIFFERYKCAALHIDDVKKEEEASNYGKVEIIRSILEKRYDGKLLTYITCNYREGDAQRNTADALVEFGERYGEHMYDRLFEMFNIIEFKGNSFRK